MSGLCVFFKKSDQESLSEEVMFKLKQEGAVKGSWANRGERVQFQAPQAAMTKSS